MSETNLHIGKLRKVDLKENQTLEDFYKEKLQSVNITKLREYDNDWEDAFKDEFNEKYFVINGIIWEVFDHIKKDSEADIIEIFKNADGTLSFAMRFYNGGTCLSECIEEGFENLII